MFSPARLRPLAVLSCLLLIIFGITCRFWNLKWDEGAHLHPDERFLTMTVPELKWPASVSEYFNSNESGLNPFNHKVDFFIYGQLPLTLCKAIAGRLPGANGAPSADNYDGILRVGRFLSALFDSGTLLLVFLLGRRLGNIMLGLLAAALLAVVPLHVQQSHFFTVDTFATFFLVATLYALCCVSVPTSTKSLEESDASPASRKIDWQNLFVAGLFFGAACACKISSLLFGAAILFWLLFTFGKGQRLRGLLAALLIFFFAFWTFRVLNPIAFRGAGGALTLWGFFDLAPARASFHGAKPVSFWLSFGEQAAISHGDIDPPWNWQWLGRANYIWPLRNLALWAVGWPLLLAGAGGIALTARRVWKKQNPAPAWPVMALWCLVVFGYYGAQYSKFSRYYLAMTPFLALLSAWFLLTIARRYRHPIALTCVASVPLLGILWCAAITSVYTRPHTRLEATRWIWANVPPGTRVATESNWDDRLPIGDVRGLVQLDLNLYEIEKDLNHSNPYRKRDNLLESLDQAEWIFSSSNRVRDTVPLAPQRWPLANEFYRALHAGELGFKLEKKFTSYPQLFGLKFPDDSMEEALTVYDHPHVMLWRKTPDWSRERAARILNKDLCDRADSRPLSEWLKKR